MNLDWLQNEKVRNRLGELLNDSGAMLEWQVSKICNEFADSATSSEVVSSERVIYNEGQDEHSLPREVDQCVTFYSSYRVADHFEVEQQLTVPIECKHRHSVAMFGMAESPTRRNLHIPSVSSLGTSPLFLDMWVVSPPMLRDTVSDVVLIEYERPMTFKGLHKEQVIDNATAALYDFVRYDLQGWQRCKPYPGQSRALEILGIASQVNDLAKLDPYVERRRQMHRLLSTLSGPDFRRFNELCSDGNDMSHTLASTLPVVCMDGPLYRVEVDETKGLGFEEVPFLVMPVRVRRWIDSLEEGLILFTPEVPVIVTTPEGLKKVLEECHEFYSALKNVVVRQSEDVKLQAPLTGVLDRLIGRRFPRDFRSDIGLGWLRPFSGE